MKEQLINAIIAKINRRSTWLRVDIKNVLTASSCVLTPSMCLDPKVERIYQFCVIKDRGGHHKGY